MCAGQRVVQEGSSPSGARMRSVISERGGNASRAGEKRKAGVAKAGTKANAGRLAAETSAVLVEFLGGQGVHREVESEGFAENHRVVLNGSYPSEEPVGPSWGMVEPALWRRRQYGSPPAHHGVCGRHGGEDICVTQGGLVSSH